MGHRYSVDKSPSEYSQSTGTGKICKHTPSHKLYHIPQRTIILNEKDLEFLRTQTNQSNEDITAIFQKYGFDKTDVQVDKRAFINIYAELHPNDNREHIQSVADHVFRAFDSDCTGYISFNEFMVGYALSSKGDVRRRLEYAFDLYDTNNTGNLDWSDVRAVITGIYDMLGASTKHENFTALVDRTVGCIGSDKVPKDDFLNGLLKSPDLNNMLSTLTPAP